MTDEVKTEQKKVIDLSAARREKSKPKKPNRADLQKELAYVMSGEPSVMGLPPFEEGRFYVINQEGGVRLPLYEKSSGLVQVTRMDHVVGAIVRYTAALPPAFEGFKWQVDECVKAAKLWLQFATPVDPKMVLWKGEPGIAYSRLPWAKDHSLIDQPTPLFDELFSRISNAETIKHWIASLFFKDSYTQQYVWMYGDGGEGKGALARFISKLFGPSACSVSPPGAGGLHNHWSSQLLGKRFVLFPDCNAAGFPASGEFKMLTGGDQIPINIKHGAVYSAHLMCKYMFLSNECVQLSGEKADLRRAIYSEVAPLPKNVIPDPKYEAKLWEEGGAFLMKVINLYECMYPEHGPIRTESDILDQLIEHLETPFEEVAARRFIFAPGRRCTPLELNRVVQESFDTKKERLEFQKFLKRRYKIPIGSPKRRVGKPGEREERWYEGFSIGPDPHLKTGVYSND